MKKSDAAQERQRKELEREAKKEKNPQEKRARLHATQAHSNLAASKKTQGALECKECAYPRGQISRSH